MLDAIALLVIVCTGFYLVILAVLSLTRPAMARNFLSGFAGSAIAHYVELLVRLAVGTAFVLCAPHLPFQQAFALLGGVLIVTTVCLFAVPWQWHHRFARWAVPHALERLKWIAVASLAAGGFILGSAGYSIVEWQVV